MQHGACRRQLQTQDSAAEPSHRRHHVTLNEIVLLCVCKQASAARSQHPVIHPMHPEDSLLDNEATSMVLEKPILHRL